MKGCAVTLKEDIKFAVTPKFIEISPNVNNLVDLAIEIWRIEQKINRALPLLPDNQQNALVNSIHTLNRYLEKYDIEIIEYTNQKFNDGLNLDVLSVEKDASQNVAIVKETVEPTVMCRGQVVHKAKVILLNK